MKKEAVAKLGSLKYHLQQHFFYFDGLQGSIPDLGIKVLVPCTADCNKYQAE